MVNNFIKAAIDRLDACADKQCEDGAFVNAMANVVSTLSHVPGSVQDLASRWNDGVITEANLQRWAVRSSLPTLEVRRKVVARLKMRFMAYSTQDKESHAIATPAEWDPRSGANAVTAFDSVPVTVAGERPPTAPPPAMRTGTVFTLPVAEVIAARPAAPTSAPLPPAPEPKEVKPVPRAKVGIEERIGKLKALIESLEDKETVSVELWCKHMRAYLSEATTADIEATLRATGVSRSQFEGLVKTGAAQNAQFTGFRVTSTTRARIILTLMLLEICRESLKYWQDIVEIAKKYQDDKDIKALVVAASKGDLKADVAVRLYWKLKRVLNAKLD